MPYHELYSMRKGKQIKQFKLDMSKQKVYVYIWIYRKLLKKKLRKCLVHRNFWRNEQTVGLQERKKKIIKEKIQQY